MCDNRFEVVVHHGGYFERNEARWSYSNGLTSTLACDPYRWSYFEIMGILREMGYVKTLKICGIILVGQRYWRTT